MKLENLISPRIRGIIGLASGILASLGIALDPSEGSASKSLPQGVEIIAKAPPDLITKYQSAAAQLDQAKAKLEAYSAELSESIGETVRTVSKSPGIIEDIAGLAGGENSIIFIALAVLMSMAGKNPFSKETKPEPEETAKPEKQG